jgi:trehalose 6-phosphate phosphatase
MTDIDQALHLLNRNDPLFVALDRDGTLVPYADRSEEAIMTEAVRQIIDDLAALPNLVLAIVSARGIVDLKNDLLDPGVILAGNYGLEILFANGQLEIQPGATKAGPLLEQVRLKLTELAKELSGSILEDHIYSLCFHWHLVAEEQRPYLHSFFANFKDQLDSSIYMKVLPTSYEFVPNLDWDKSHALQRITDYLGLTPHSCLNLYIGDTESDEPAFTWVNRYSGVSIRVGTQIKTAANFVLPAPKNVAHFLKRLKVQRENWHI